MEIRRLEAGDDRSQFQSGQPDLDRFLHQFAGQNQFKLHIGVTYVAVEKSRIAGYLTVAPAHIEIEGLPASLRKKLPDYPLPMLRFARLAVDRSVQGQGLGKELLRHALRLAAQMGQDFGCLGVLVDAKHGAESFYSAYGFVPLDALEGASDARPRPVPMFLSLNAIVRAMAWRLP